MISASKAASYIYHRYEKQFDSKISEMKLHKLLYFTQRECLVMFNEPMFAEEFSAWKYGPVLISVHHSYRKNDFNTNLNAEELRRYSPVFDYIFSNYAEINDWSLSMLSHGETSWKNARIGIHQNWNSSNKLKLEDIRSDAERISFRRFYFDVVKSEGDYYADKV